MFAAVIRKCRIEGMKFSRWRWHLNQMFVIVNCERDFLWRVVKHESEVLESFVTETQGKKAAIKFFKKAVLKHGRPEAFVTEKLRSYGAAPKELGSEDQQKINRWKNNRAENSHLSLR
ncbi:putative transposase [Roseivivax halotolerans]|uniref:Putative transposase n=1 Tax=Roseivivax halotolerans TaxID=93684 RepID=A0A1I5ZQE6_9RHOB|nr:putative transposase [Roseivivax halotolerans]